jgi:NTE family protein
MAAYGATPHMADDSAVSDALEHVPTRLSAFDAERQGHLINWGYALCDVSLRARAGLPVPMASAWPVPEWPL